MEAMLTTVRHTRVRFPQVDIKIDRRRSTGGRASPQSAHLWRNYGNYGPQVAHNGVFHLIPKIAQSAKQIL